MIEKIIVFSVKNKLVTGLLLLVFVCTGIYSLTRLPLDALPDVTNNQVQVITNAPNLATQEVEQFITYPIEMQMKTIPDVTELRSTSRSGLSVITIVFKDQVNVQLARQHVAEKLKMAEEELPKQFGSPEIIPPTTGLGEIFQYTLSIKKGYKKQYPPMELRSIQDWIVRRQLLGVPGIVDVSSFGGYLKEYEVAVQAEKLVSMNISLTEVFDALSKNNSNTGGSYIEKGPNIYFIRGEGLAHSFQDIENIVVKNTNGIPIKIRDIAQVQWGHAPRYGAMTRNGNGETVGGIVLMLKGENSVDVIKRVKERITSIEKSLPEGVFVDVFVDRSKLITKTIQTVSTNLIEGALIVILVLVLLLGNLRAGFIVASVIPLAMLFAIMMMNVFGVSANLMSMGALDFGLIVDGAVIIVESMLHLLATRYRNQLLTAASMDNEVIASASRIMKSAVFGQIIILIVYIPIFALTGIEGKMFLPMAQTVSFSILGALILSITYVPLMSSLFLSKRISIKESISERFIQWVNHYYIPFMTRALRHRIKWVVASVALLVGAILLFNTLGGEFIPELDEGDFATNYTIRQGSNLSQTIETGTRLEKILLNNFPEVKEVVSKIGTSEVPTDPMPVESADLIIVLKDKKEWTHATNKDELAEKMHEKMSVIPGMNLSFEQPIQMRFNELIAGVKSDIAIKIFGENLDVLFDQGNKTARFISGIEGLTDIKVEQVVGMPQLVVQHHRERIAQYGLNIDDVNRILNTALAGGKAGVIYEGERKYNLVVRLAQYRDADEEKLKNIFIPLPGGTQIPLSQLADIRFQSAPAQISREDAERRIVIEANVRGRDIEGVVHEIQSTLQKKLHLPAGYYLTYEGTFKNLQEARQRLQIAVPVALFLIFMLLFLSFRNLTESMIIFSAIPLAAIGGVIALWVRQMNFSISAGIGFIALFGVAVLNGIVLISQFNRLKEEGIHDSTQRILKGCSTRLRPVLATAAVASLGFLPMALSTSAGSEIQKPLATVVIGGLLSSTLLTLIILPILYSLFTSGHPINLKRRTIISAFVLTGFFMMGNSIPSLAQRSEIRTYSLDSVVAIALRNHPAIRSSEYSLEQNHTLKSKFLIEPMNMNWTLGQINSSVIDYNFTMSSGIKSIPEQRALFRIQEEQIALGRLQKQISEAEVKRDVTLAFIQTQFACLKVEVLDSLETLYEHFAHYANIKYKTGESALLEKMEAESLKKSIRLKQMEGWTARSVALHQLQEMMGQEDSLSIAFIPDFLLPLPTLEKKFVHQANPLFQYQMQQQNVYKAQYKVEKSKMFPTLQLGYFNQSLDKRGNYSGVSVGSTLPLFKSGMQKKIQSSLLGIRIAETETERVQRFLQNAYYEAWQECNQYRESIDFYKKDQLPLSNKMAAVANQLYQQGEIAYTEYILAMQHSYEIKIGYLEALLHYNQCIVQLNYLLNQE